MTAVQLWPDSVFESLSRHLDLSSCQAAAEKAPVSLSV